MSGFPTHQSDISGNFMSESMHSGVQATEAIESIEVSNAGLGPSLDLGFKSGLFFRTSLVAEEPNYELSFLSMLFEGSDVIEQSITFRDAMSKLVECSEVGALPIRSDILQKAINECEEFSTKYCTEHFGGPLNIDEVAAIHLYTLEFVKEWPECTTNFYEILNRLLRSEDRESLIPWMKVIVLLLRALSKCSFPALLRFLYRGMKSEQPFDLTKYSKGNITTWYQFSSCSIDLEVQHRFVGEVGHRIIFKIELGFGRARKIGNYSKYPNETEVILPPNTRLLVHAVFPLGHDLTMIELKEVAPIDTIVDFGFFTEQMRRANIDWRDIRVDTSVAPEDSLLGSGSFGTVVKALWDGKHVAIKFVSQSRKIPPNLVEDARKKFTVEAEISMRARSHMLDKEFICEVFGIAYGLIKDQPELLDLFDMRHDGLCAGIVMCYERGGNLWQRIHVTRPELTTPEKIDMTAQLFRAVAEIHGIGLVHGDLKPENILLSADSPPRLRLADFGQAEYRKHNLEISLGNSLMQSTVTPRGSPIYAAPEILQRKNTSRSTDLYSSGILLYELWSGIKPFADAADLAQLFDKVVTLKERPDLSTLPGDTPSTIRSLLAACWSDSRTARPSAVACFQRLEELIQSTIGDVITLSPSERASSVGLCTSLGQTISSPGKKPRLSIQDTADIARVTSQLGICEEDIMRSEVTPQQTRREEDREQTPTSLPPVPGLAVALSMPPSVVVGIADIVDPFQFVLPPPIDASDIRGLDPQRLWFVFAALLQDSYANCLRDVLPAAWNKKYGGQFPWGEEGDDFELTVDRLMGGCDFTADILDGCTLLKNPAIAEPAPAQLSVVAAASGEGELGSYVVSLSPPGCYKFNKKHVLHEKFLISINGHLCVVTNCCRDSDNNAISITVTDKVPEELRGTDPTEWVVRVRIWRGRWWEKRLLYTIWKGETPHDWDVTVLHLMLLNTPHKLLEFPGGQKLRKALENIRTIRNVVLGHAPAISLVYPTFYKMVDDFMGAVREMDNCFPGTSFGVIDCPDAPSFEAYMRRALFIMLKKQFSPSDEIVERVEAQIQHSQREAMGVMSSEEADLKVGVAGGL